jgi:hypothetical protein
MENPVEGHGLDGNLSVLLSPRQPCIHRLARPRRNERVVAGADRGSPGGVRRMQLIEAVRIPGQNIAIVR